MKTEIKLFIVSGVFMMLLLGLTVMNDASIEDLRGDLTMLEAKVNEPPTITRVDTSNRRISYEIAPLDLEWKADYHTRFEMTKDLFLEVEKTEGVSWVTGYRYYMEVGKADMFTWNEIHPKIMKILNNY